MTRGGPQPGSGRPRSAPDGAIRIGVTIGDRDAETLDTVADRAGLPSRPAAVRHLVRLETSRISDENSYLREWLESNDPNGDYDGMCYVDMIACYRAQAGA